MIKLALLILLAAVTACSHTPTTPAIIHQQSLEALTAPDKKQSTNIVDKLTPPSLLPPLAQPKKTEKRFDIIAKNQPIASLLLNLAADSPYNIVLHPQVQGSVNLELTQVTVFEVLDILRTMYGYPWHQKGTILQVFPGGTLSRVFQLNYLNIQRRGFSETRVSAGQVSENNSSNNSSNDSNNNGSNNNNNSNSNNNNSSDSSNSGSVVGTLIQTENQADFWLELEDTLYTIIGRDNTDDVSRSVIVNAQSGIIVIRALAKELAAVEEFLTKSELTLQRQVILEAKILEIQLDDGFQAGINWTAVGLEAGTGKTVDLSLSSSTVANSDGIGGVFSVDMSLGDFQGVIELLENQGTVQVLSSPRISTINNQKAVIKVGTDEFFVTDISSTTTTGTSTTTTPSVELTPFFSGIALDVTPQISANGQVILHIHPIISEVKDQTKVITIGEDVVSLPLAFSTIREADSVVQANNGQIVVIGGLMQKSSDSNLAQTPFLGNIPLIGKAFQQKRNSSRKSELVILLRANIVNGDTPSDYLQQRQNAFRELGGEI